MPRQNALRACADFHTASEATRARMLDGGLTRRRLLLRGAGAGLALYASRALPLGRVLEAAEEANAAAPAAPVLVCVFLPGGVDLLDTIVPRAQYGHYADLRPNLRQPESAPALAGTGLSSHPSLTAGVGGGIAGLAARGQVGLLPGIDYANPDLSHFHSRAFWESGLVTHRAATGWLGRYLDRLGAPDNALQGLTMGSVLSPLLRSAHAPVAAVESASATRSWVPGVWGEYEDRAWQAWRELAAVPRAAGGRHAAGQAARLMRDVAERLAPYVHEEKEPDPLRGTVAYPPGALGKRLGTLAGLLSQPLGIRVAAVEGDDSFDTHDQQRSELGKGLRAVSRALSAFQADLTARGLADRVLTLVWSEFGRRAQQNSSGGTDHGAGGVAWVQGTRVAPGVLTEYPDLRRLRDGGNLAVTVDFRRVYCSLLEQWLGTEAAAVIPGADAFGRVSLVR